MRGEPQPEIQVLFRWRLEKRVPRNKGERHGSVGQFPGRLWVTGLVLPGIHTPFLPLQSVEGTLLTYGR